MSLKKKYLIGKEARQKLLAGAAVVYDLVSPTSGPKGRNVAYSRPWGLPRIINDGIEIAKEVGSEDEFENVGIDLIREAAQNTVTDAGDGTTTSIILAFHILRKGMEAIDRETSPANPMVLRTQMTEALATLLTDIHKLSTKVTTKADLKRVALISSSYDEEIATVVSETVHEMGLDGVVTVEEGNGLTITNEITKGMQLSKGYIDPRFVTDDMRMESVIVEPAVIVFEKVVTSQNEIVPIMNEVAKRTKNVVIFGDIRGDALATLILNKARGVFQLVAINPPGYQEKRLAILTDIASVTGARIITSETESFYVGHAGGASHISANKTTTTIVGGTGSETVVESRVKEIRDQQEEGNLSLYEKEVLEERLAKLTAGVALIKVGARSETLKREKLERVKDAVGACKAALAEGIVVGGGMAFIALAKKLKAKGKLNEGEEVLYNVLLEPTKKILFNSGKNSSEVKMILDELLTVKKDFGYNVSTDKIENLMESGVIDPLRVIRLSLENGVVVATSIFTAEGLVIDAPPPTHATSQ